MRKIIVALATLAALVAVPGAALAASAPGIGSGVDGRDSAGGQFTFAFDALTHGSLTYNYLPISGAYMYSLGDSFNCSGKKGMKLTYSFNTFNQDSSFTHDLIQPFPAVDHSYQSFHYLFSTKLQNASGLKNVPGKAVVSITGRIKQISGPVGGPGKAIANGTIGIRISSSCHTGTLKWTAKGSIVSPN